MEVKFNTSELRLINVNSYWFFNYLTQVLNKFNKCKVNNFNDLLTFIYNNKYNNILAKFIYFKRVQDIFNIYYKNHNKNLTIICDYEKMLIKLDDTCMCEINIIINNFNENYDIYDFFMDYLQYENEMLNN